MIRCMLLTLALAACVPDEAELAMRVVDQCREVVREEMPLIILATVPAITEAAKAACADIGADVEELRDNIAGAMLLYLGCLPAGEGWDCVGAHDRLCGETP
jgi:hypothetical protein